MREICILCGEEIDVKKGRVEEVRRRSYKNVLGEDVTAETKVRYCAPCWMDKEINNNETRNK